jgi:hypothetical protein
MGQDAVRVLWPDGNEVYAWGDTMRIRWEASASISLVGVALSVDAGNTWCDLYAGGISQGAPGWGDTTWVVTPYLSCPSGSVSVRSSACLVKVSNYLGTEFDRSDGPFTIDSTPAPALLVLEPNGGETFVLGDTLRIRWQAGPSVPMARVILSVDGGDRWCDLYPGGGISRGSPNWGDTMWVVTPYLACAPDSVHTLSASCLVRVANYVGFEEDRSDTTFSIVALRLLQPNGGEWFEVGDTVRIMWRADTSTIAMVSVQYSSDGGDVWSELYTDGIDASSPTWGDTTWIIPYYVPHPPDSVSTVSGSCLIRVANYLAPTEEDRSDASFTIADSVHVELPPVDEPSDCGCGSGTEAALIPPFVFWVGRRVRRRRTSA